MENRTGPTPAEALAIADAVVQTRYGGAAFAYVAGSIMRGEGTWLSDIDLVVVFDRLDAARRESFAVDGVPVEAFVHDPGTLARFVDDDVERGRPSLLDMIGAGVVVGRDRERAEALRADISARLASGPPPLSAAALDVLRYEITDAMDDLRGNRTASETMATGVMLYPKLAELALRGRGHWEGAGKWTPRLLSKFDAGLAHRFDGAFRALFADGDCGPVIALAEVELAPHGGRLFDGDRRVAPASWRIDWATAFPQLYAVQRNQG